MFRCLPAVRLATLARVALFVAATLLQIAPATAAVSYIGTTQSVEATYGKNLQILGGESHEDSSTIANLSAQGSDSNLSASSSSTMNISLGGTNMSISGSWSASTSYGSGATAQQAAYVFGSAKSDFLIQFNLSSPDEITVQGSVHLNPSQDAFASAQLLSYPNGVETESWYQDIDETGSSLSLYFHEFLPAGDYALAVNGNVFASANASQGTVSSSGSFDLGVSVGPVPEPSAALLLVGLPLVLLRRR